MTALAQHAGEDVLTVVEIHEVRKVVNLYPANGRMLLYRFLELFDLDRLLI